MQLARAGLVRPLASLTARHTPLPTGIPALDGLLGGGLPRGALTILAGGESSGAAGLALKLNAGMQRAGRLCAWLDFTHSFDPIQAVQAGVTLNDLLLARPASISETLGIAYDLLCEGSAGLVLLGTGNAAIPDASLRLLTNALVRSDAVLVWLAEPGVRIPQADVRLSATRLSWEAAGGDVGVLRTRITVEAGRAVPVGRSAECILAVDEAGPCWSAS
jgi:hypothetical protein